MDRDQHAELLGWLRRCLSEDAPSGQPTSVFVLRFFGERYRNEEPIDDWIVRDPSSRKVKMDIDVLCGEIETAMKTQTEAIGGLVKFRLYALPQGSPKAWRTKVLKEFSAGHEEEDEHGNPVRDEKESREGREEARMRHHETMHRLMTSTIMEMTQALKDENRDLRQQRDTFAAKHLQLVQVTENMLSQNKLREIMEQDAVAKRQVVAKVGENLNIVVPLLLHKYFGMPLPSGQESLEAKYVKNFVRTLKPEQIMPFLASLTDAQRAPMVELIEQVLNEDEEAKKKQAAQMSTVVPSQLRATNEAAEEKKTAAE